ncbi:MAG: FAD-dependent oxidoreductase [Candidatus Omnitrophica bacterium]|nr:FAD-dependent oxidoreductase [Candidatus Omnitrophota bacterium]
MSKKIVILGGGLSGLSAAWHLKEKGLKSAVYEKEDSVGGLCRSKKSGNFIFDYDGHLLHFQNNYTLELVTKLLKGNLARHERCAWISNFGIFSRYPFQANLHALPKKVAIECLWGFLRVCNTRSSGDGKNFLKWINANLGQGIAKYFMIPYNEKFWTVPLNQMVCSTWTDKFIPQVYLYDIVSGFFGTNGSGLGYNASFWYPKRGGIVQLPLAFEKQSGPIFKNCLITGIDLKNKEITIKDKGKQRFDRLIYTIPLPELARIAGPLPKRIIENLNKLRWNSIFNLNLAVEGRVHPGKHWVYFPQKNTVFFRAGFYHNFSGSNAPDRKSSLYTEVSYSKDKPINKKTVIKRILDGLHSKNIIGRKNKILAMDQNDIDYGYPIYDSNYLRATAEIKEFLAAKDIIACGRYGSWKYMSMEDSILDGKLAASKILKKCSKD